MIKTPLSTVIGGAFWTPGCTVIGGNTSTFGQQILKLFANGEQGFAYDPNDLSTMWQDAAGTVPVTAAGQPVGLMLDKSKGVTYSENLSNTGTQQALGSQSTLNDGWWDITRTTSAFPGISQTSLETNSLYKVKVSWKESTSGVIRIEFLSTGAYIFTTRSAVSGSWEGYVNSLDRTQLNVYFRDVVNAGYCGSIKIDSIQKIAGNHALQTTSASRPILQRNATTSAYYLAFDGADDFLQTNSIDFTATDKVTVIAAIGKLSDASAYQLVYELSANAETNNGAFRMMAPGLDTEKGIVFGSRGTSQTSVNIRDYPAPIKLLTTMQASIGTPLLKARVNGVQVSNTAASQGTGNYGNHPLYIGRRAGTSFQFNGHLYSLIGIGRLTTDSETIALEKEFAKRVGATLNV